MARYRVLRRSYIGGVLHEPGAVIEFAGKPGSALQVLDKPAAPAADEAPAPEKGKPGRKPAAPAA